MRRNLLLVLSMVFVIATAGLPAAGAGANDPLIEDLLLRLLNDHRLDEGLAPLNVYWDLVDDARAHSRFQSEGRCPDGSRVCHNPDLGSVATNWWTLGENVAVGLHAGGIDRAFWASPNHRANIVGNYNYAGVGVATLADGSVYVTVIFMLGPTGLPGTDPSQPPSDGPDPYQFPPGADLVGQHNGLVGRWSLDGLGSAFYYGIPSDMPVVCDWDGDGESSIGLYRGTSGYLYLRNSNTFGVADTSIFYGIPGDQPVCGDWDGDGIESIGVYRPSTATFYLRNTNTLGVADVEIQFGREGDIPLVGDWYGRGYASVAGYRPATGILYLADGKERLGNVIAIPRADIAADDGLVVGDWDANGVDTLGFYRPSRGAFQLFMGHEAWSESVEIPFGSPGLSPVVGDWA